jgi:hypothetical protein
MEASTMRRQRTLPTLTGLAALSGVVLVAQAVVAALTDQNDRYAGSTGDALADSLLAAGLLLSLAGLVALRRTLARRTGALAIAGQATIVLAIAVTIAAGRESLDAVYIVGTVAWIVGLLGVAFLALRSHDPRYRPAVALPVAGLLALGLADSGGAVLLGLTWLVLSAGMRHP